MRFGRDDDDTSWCRLDKSVEQQLDEIEVTEMIRLECRLVTIVSQSVRHGEHTSVQYQHVQRPVVDITTDVRV